MGRHQRAESAGLVSFLCSAIISGVGMMLYMDYASAIWQVSMRRFMVCAAFVACCGVVSFIVGYVHRSRVVSATPGLLGPLRRGIEILALSIVYAATLFLTSFMLFSLANSTMGTSLFTDYIPALTAAFSGISGYITFVQAELMDAKTLASLLPLFIVSGVITASMTTNDPNWFRNNFSQLGDRTTFAARMFNATLIVGGVCVIIISYFAISELIATYRVRFDNPDVLRTIHVGYKIPRFYFRIGALTVLLLLSGLCFIGIGLFRYTPHPLIHNVFARGLPCIMGLLLISLPWLAPQLSRTMYVVSDIALLAAAIAGISWIMGHNTLTNVEALAGMLFLGWFIVFSRQIAAIESDRIQRQLVQRNTGITNDFELEQAVRNDEQLVFESSLQGPLRPSHHQE
ncbi:hypothetical protein [Bifidobacterium gallicum]|nr:hypothetical protein [Bifidobacterium gallicum]